MQKQIDMLNTWVDQTSKTDLQVSDKLPLMTDKVARMAQKEGPPKNDNEVWERFNRAYEEVNNDLKKFQPTKPPVNPSPKSTGAPAAPVSQPDSFEEALSQGIRNITAGAARQ